MRDVRKAKRTSLLWMVVILVLFVWDVIGIVLIVGKSYSKHEKHYTETIGIDNCVIYRDGRSEDDVDVENNKNLKILCPETKKPGSSGPGF